MESLIKERGFLKMGKRVIEKGSEGPLFQRIMLLAAIAAGIILIALMLLTVSDVFLRFFFKKPIIGIHEITASMMICIGFLGLAWAALTDRHIKVDLLVSKFPPRAQKYISYINYLLVGISCVVLAVESYHRSLAVRKLGVASEMLNIPQFPFYIVVSIGHLLLLLAIVVIVIREVQSR